MRLFNNLTLTENVEAAALAHGHGRRAAREKAHELLAEFGLEQRGDDLAVGLSYGDKRRVEIARALAADPEYLLLDEPAAGMNEAETGELLAILETLPQTRGLSLLIIDHDMGLIMRLCERLHVLASGRTIAEGDRDAVRANPAKNVKGGLVRSEAPLHISNVAVVCPETNAPTRVAYKVLEDGSKSRVSKQGGIIDKA